MSQNPTSRILAYIIRKAPWTFLTFPSWALKENTNCMFWNPETERRWETWRPAAPAWLSLPWHQPKGWICLCGTPAGKHHPDLFSEVETQATIISCHSKLKAQAHPSREQGEGSRRSAKGHNDRLGCGWCISFKGMSHSWNTQNKQRHKSPWKRPTSESKSLCQDQRVYFDSVGDRRLWQQSAQQKMSFGLCLR